MLKKLYSLSAAFVISYAATAQSTAVVHDEVSFATYRTEAKAFAETHHMKSYLDDLVASVVTDKSLLKDFQSYISAKEKLDRHDFVVKVGENKLSTEQELESYKKTKRSEYESAYAGFISQRSKSLINPPQPFDAGQPCQNMDFESGTLAGWVGSYGSSQDPTAIAGISQPPNNSTTGVHTIMTTGNDPNISSIPCVAPGGTASVRLGDNGGGGNWACRLSQTFMVSTTNPYFQYQYAVVLEDGGHVVSEQPYFKVRMYDASNNPISCATIDVDATNAAGLSTSGAIRYKNWTNVLVPLTGYAGTNVRIEFTAADCNNSPPHSGSHDGYAYLDGSCNYVPTITASAAVLCTGQTMTLTGPPGLGAYSWSGPGIVSGGSSQVVTINAGGTYTLNLTTQTTPPNTPCSFSMNYTVPSASSAAQFTSTTVCVGTPTTLTDGSAPAGSISNWQWDFNNDGITDATTQNPTYTFPAAGTYPVTLTVTAGSCISTVTNNVSVTASGSPDITSVPPVCSNASAFNLSASLGGGTWSGSGITDGTAGTFDPSTASASSENVITYTITGACAGTDTVHITVIPSSTATWTPSTLCELDAPLDLNTLVTGTSGGTWSGTGVTGSMFDPSGLSGPVSVTYTVGSSPCVATSTQSITVNSAVNPSITSVSPVCSNAAAFGLTASVTGGTWSGTGITDAAAGTFDPASAASGTNVITYTIAGACGGTDTVHVTVVPSASPAWTAAPMCSSDAPVDLNTLVSGTAGGTWSGTGVTGSTFDPSGLSGPVSVTYTVGSSPCVGTQTHTITVTPSADATITSVAALCQDASSVTLTAVSPGGTWSGTGVSSAGVFTPSTALAGSNTITYSIAGSCGDTDTIHINVIPSGNPAFSLPASICAGDAPLDLGTMITGTPGGTFTGTGVSGNTFDPSGLSGNVTITYTVGTIPCQHTSTMTINVDAIDAAFTATPVSGQAPLHVDFTNGSTNAAVYDWTFGNGSSSGSVNPSTEYPNMGVYNVVLVATNSNGCTDTARIIIHVDELSVLTVPNVFTPNGDGHNDVFQPIQAKGLASFEATVYDRWGLKMYEWSDYNSGWNGKSKNGADAPDGTYYYIIQGKGVDGKDYSYTGFISLIRK